MGAIHNKATDAVARDGVGKTIQRDCHLGHRSMGSRRLYEGEPTVAARNHEVHLEALLITKVVKLSGPPISDLMLDDLGRHEPFEDRTEERRPTQLPV